MKFVTAFKSGILILFLIINFKSIGQNCTLTAGVDQALCEATSTTLTSNISGSFIPGSELWIQTGGPVVTVTTPNSTTTNVTGLTPGNIYTFTFQAECTIGGVITDVIAVDNQSLPTISAGPDASLCLTGNVMMNAVIPAGYTGTWSSSAGYIQFSDVNDPNAIVTSSNSCPWNPNVTLTWTVSNGVCSTSDQMTLTLGIDINEASFPSTNDIICGTTYSAVIWCAHLANSTITFTPINNPSGITPTANVWGQNSINLSFTGLNALGIHQFEVSLTSNVCGGTLIDTITFNVDALTPPDADFSTNIGLSYGQGGPQYYRYCEADFNEDTIWMYANTATPSGGTSTWTINNGGLFWPYTIDDPNADTTFMTFNGGGFSSGSIYYIRRTVNTVGGCESSSVHGTILYETPDPITTVDTVICSGNAVNLGLAEGMFPIHDANSSYPRFVLSSSTGVMTQIGGPTATITRVYTNNWITSDDYFRFSGLTQGNVYTFVYSLGNNSSTYAYNNCYSGALRDTFTITYAEPVGVATGTDQFLSCNNTTTGLVGNEDVGQTGVWSFASGPATPTITDVNSAATDITGLTVDGDYFFHWTVSTPCESKVDSVKVTVQSGGEPTIFVNDMPNCIGDLIDLTSSATAQAPGTGPLYYSWDTSGVQIQGQNITNINAGQTNYTVTVIDSSILCSNSATLSLVCPLPVKLINFEGRLINYNKAQLSWTTVTELNNDFFILERSSDLIEWELVKFVDGAGTTNSVINYSELDTDLLKGTSYYRLTQIDFDGTAELHPDLVVINRTTQFNSVNIYPNPATETLNLSFSQVAENISNPKIYSISGKLIHEVFLNNVKEIKVDLNELNISEGTYLISVTIDGEQISQRLIIH